MIRGFPATIFTLVLMSSPPSGAADESTLVARAKSVHERVFTIDSHVDLPLAFATPEVDPGEVTEGQVDLPRMAQGGLDAAFFIVYVPQTERTDEAYDAAIDEAMSKFDAVHRMTAKYADRIGLADTSDEALAIHRGGRLVAFIGIENGFAIGRKIERLALYRKLGARYMTLAHNGHNDIADSAQPKSQWGEGAVEHGGLSPFGYEVVRELNRQGILVDVSHVAKRSMLAAAEFSAAPVIASHSNAKAVHDHPRNMDDEMMLALKATGGVMQATAFSSYLVPDSEEKKAALKTLRDDMGLDSSAAFRAMTKEERETFRRRRADINERYGQATVAQFVDHIDYAVRLIGIDHVGISSDFNGGGGVEGWNDAGDTFNVTLELVRRGYSDEDIAKLWGLNLLRVMREADRIAAELQALDRETATE